MVESAVGLCQPTVTGTNTIRRIQSWTGYNLLFRAAIGQGYNSDGDSVGTALEVDSVFTDALPTLKRPTGFELVATQDKLTEAWVFRRH